VFRCTSHLSTWKSSNKHRQTGQTKNLPPAHSGNKYFTVLEGFVDTDAYSAPVNFPFVLNDIDFEGLIPAGTPMVQVIPIKRDSWQKEIASVEKSEAIFTKQRLSVRSVFTNGYKLFYRARKTFK
jgi:hypothetical protein